MKKNFIIANWKSHKTYKETVSWLNELALKIHEAGSLDQKDIIICPPYPLLPVCHEYVDLHKLPIAIGSQNISPFAEGAYTGEVDGKLLHDFVQYVIIGHSERRKYFKETIGMLAEKVAMARSFGLSPIYCVSDKEEKIPLGVDIVAYEPLMAIGSGKPDSPEDAEAVAGFIKQKNGVSYVLYGGSVTSKSVANFTRLASINGVLIGGASLSPDEFAAIIQHA